MAGISLALRTSGRGDDCERLARGCRRVKDRFGLCSQHLQRHADPAEPGVGMAPSSFGPRLLEHAAPRLTTGEFGLAGKDQNRVFPQKYESTPRHLSFGWASPA